ncbi:hypothetical protein Tco_0770843 [Tanacetum coccineum]|uniref:Uncharacterized protein n=1 Tax=Tanacetum coccineum TaxID=301880 RepID=A0ABQ4ZG75_9ASTR
MSMDYLYNNLKVYEPGVKGMSSVSSSIQNMAFVSSLNNNTSSTNEAVNTAHEVSTASTQFNAANSTNIDNLSDAVICTFFKVFERIQEGIMLMAMRSMVLLSPKVECYNATRGDFLCGECRAPRNKTSKNMEDQEECARGKHLIQPLLCHVWILVGYDWSDQAEKGPNYALMAFLSSSSDSEVSNDSICSKSCLKTIESLKSQNDQLLKDLKKSELMVLACKICLESVEEKT